MSHAESLVLSQKRPWDPERAHWVLLSMVAGIGPVRFSRLLDVCGDAQRAWRASDVDLANAGFERRSAESLRQLRRTLTPEAAMARLEKLRLSPLTLLDADYPDPLRQINDPPPVLYVRGAFDPRDARAVAIVGTRRMSTYGRAVAERLARDLALAGVTVVSGLAKGVDTVAHTAALDAGGRSIGVLANGLDQVYPPENVALARRMADQGQGAVISEFAPGVPPDAVNFPRRNRIVSGLALGTIVVEAGMKSGALITADFALEQGRDVFAVPGSILSASSAGSNNLLKQGAAPITEARDVLDALDIAPTAVDGASAHAVHALSPSESAVLGALGREPTSADVLARTLGLGSGEVAATLTMLELKGVVSHVGSMTYVLT